MYDETKDAKTPEEEIRQLFLLSKTPEIVDFSSVTKLDLFSAGLSSLPGCLSQVLPNLSILFCMRNKFDEMPLVIGECEKLQMVSFKSNLLRTIHPQALQKQLRWLILTDNQIVSLPETIGNCTNLQKLMLSGNELTELPQQISKCQNLELIRLASNKLSKPPLTLLNLKNLSWLALSDNPFLTSVRREHAIQLKLFEDDHLEDAALGTVLGKGASGITRQFSTMIDEKEQEVAVKEYFSKITSDGNPQEERQVSMVASSLNCSSIIQVLGQTRKGNLVMQLLTDYQVLADPPSLESCSRDVYSPSRQLSETHALTMIRDLLHALMRLHKNGICHGDFYGHNILYNPSGKCWLTDFGAAFFYSPDQEYGTLIQTIEKRAFRHLVTEVCDIIAPCSSSSGTSAKDKLLQLASCCEEFNFEELYKKYASALEDMDIDMPNSAKKMRLQ